jgi:hypothetical protein
MTHWHGMPPVTGTVTCKSSSLSGADSGRLSLSEAVPQLLNAGEPAAAPRQMHMLSMHGYAVRRVMQSAPLAGQRSAHHLSNVEPPDIMRRAWARIAI